MKTVINIMEDGTAESLGSVDIPDVEVIRKIRVSTIQPAHPVKRAWFKLLRLVFGDSGRVAEYTRQFSGAWVVTILRSGQAMTFETRSACIKWETLHLNTIQRFRS